MRRPPHYAGNYQARSRKVRDRANADPLTRCWQCGRTKAEHRRKWTAGHVVDGQVNGQLLPECERCNFSRGATAGNARRGPLETTEDY